MLFKKLEDILQEGCIVTITVTKAADGNLTVSAAMNNKLTEDPGKGYIQPFVVTGSAAELDAEFPELISKPLERSAGLQTSMKEFEASVKEAQNKSKAATQQKAAADQEKKARKAAFDKAFAKGEALEKENKTAEALAAYKDAASKADPSDKPKADRKVKELTAKLEQPSLDFFESDETETTAQETEEENETED